MRHHLGLPLWVLASLLVTAAASGQTVQGRVVDAASGDAVADATVVLRSDTHALQTTSDSSGAFRLSTDVAGRYLLVVSHPAWMDVPTLDVTLEQGATRDVEVRLRRDVVAGDTLVVEARDASADGTFEGAMARYRSFPDFGFRRVVTHNEPELRVSMKLEDALRFFPVGSCTILLHNGLLARGESEMWMDLPADAVEALEFYRRPYQAPRGVRELAMSADPMGYMADCSIVALWSRRTPTQTTRPLLRLLGTAVASVLLVMLLR
ncbi:MAG TPA: carboxypeptidase-like regulatory domain-containing protein [Longimicrobiales bacterium]|nr:carboxypeptidase-like regulatory domain-containing protein [Longimicrobiales bacterium]